jgi:hypothetical protein
MLSYCAQKLFLLIDNKGGVGGGLSVPLMGLVIVSVVIVQYLQKLYNYLPLKSTRQGGGEIGRQLAG